jgi:hypothetical protein
MIQYALISVTQARKSQPLPAFKGNALWPLIDQTA